MLEKDNFLANLNIFSIFLFAIFLIIYGWLVNTREITGTEVFIFIPGINCVFVTAENNVNHDNPEKFYPCTYFGDSISFEYAKGIFEPIKKYNFDSIGYHKLDIDWKPHFYFLGGNVWEVISFFGMFLIGSLQLAFFSFYWNRRKYNS